MKLNQLFSITSKYINTKSKIYRESKKGGNAKDVAYDFAKFCKKNGVNCFVIEGTFRLDKKQENGINEVDHWWNQIDDGMHGDGGTGTYADKSNPNNDKKTYMITDFSVKPTYEDTGLATDNSRDRYKKIKEITV